LPLRHIVFTQPGSTAAEVPAPQQRPFCRSLRLKADIPPPANLGLTFVGLLGSRADCSAIVRAVTTLGANLSMANTAEG
jgi:hypothetical protein